jgi:hypothetical protein
MSISLDQLQSAIGMTGIPSKQEYDAFTQYIEGIGQALHRKMILPDIRTIHELEYSSSSQVRYRETWFLKFQIFELILHISWKGQYYCFSAITHGIFNNSSTSYLGISEIPKTREGNRFIKAAREMLDVEGYTLLDRDTLIGKVPERKTDLDGSPATVFEVLFTEL